MTPIFTAPPADHERLIAGATLLVVPMDPMPLGNPSSVEIRNGVAVFLRGGTKELIAVPYDPRTKHPVGEEHIIADPGRPYQKIYFYPDDYDCGAPIGGWQPPSTMPPELARWTFEAKSVEVIQDSVEDDSVFSKRWCWHYHNENGLYAEVESK